MPLLTHARGHVRRLPACHPIATPCLTRRRARLDCVLPGAGNITRHPAYRSYFKESDAFPNADRIMAEGFLLGCHHGTTFAQIDRACELLKAFEAKGQKE